MDQTLIIDDISSTFKKCEIFSLTHFGYYLILNSGNKYLFVCDLK